MRWIWLVVVIACGGDEDGSKPDLEPGGSGGGGGGGDDTASVTDGDGDGWTADEDCDDTDADVHPQAEEYCNGVDDDCNGDVDDKAEDATTWYPDGDGDGYGAADSRQRDCSPPEDAVFIGEDCDDTRADVHPDADEIPCDGVDSDCDGSLGPSLVLADGEEHATLQDAIDAVAAGGRVDVCGGDHDSVVIAATGDVEIAGTEGATVSGSGTTSAVSIEGGTVSLGGLVLLGGRATRGAGLLVASGSTVHVEDCRITGNTADEGGGVYLGSGTTASLVDTTIDLNSADNGGGLAIGPKAVVTLERVAIASNTASGQGGGVSVGYESVVSADADTHVSDNTAVVQAGGVDLDWDTAWSGGVIERNSVQFSGGGLSVSCSTSSSATVTDVLVEGNTAELYGGGARVDCTTTLTGVELVDNTAFYDGGGLYLDAGYHTATLDGCVVRDNVTTAGRGGGAQVEEGHLVSVSTDWGTGTSDNSPVDVCLGDVLDDERPEYDYGADATFTCTVMGGTPACE